MLLETYGYGDDSDQPIFVRSATAAAPNTTTGWTRNVGDPTGALAALVTNSGSAALQVSNVRGDVVSEISATTGATGLGAKFYVDEFGIPIGTTMGQRKYGLLGSQQRESVIYGHIIAMGVRSYSPWSGRFLQPDPVQGGSANTYDYVNQDPINEVDLDGRCMRRAGRCQVGTVTASEDAAVIRKARINSERTALQLRREASAAARAGQGKFRATLVRQSGMTRAQAQPYDAHHMLPVKNAYEFKRAGLDVNEPRFGMLVERQHHRGIGSAWNKSWDNFWARHNGVAPPELIEQHLHNIARDIMGVTWP